MALTRNAVWPILMLIGVGCTAHSPTLSPRPMPPRPSAAPPADVTVSSDGEGEAAARGYRQFWIVAYTLDAHPTAEWPTRLAAVATEPILPKLLGGLQEQRAAGIREYGQVRPRLVTVEIRGDVATVFDCQDASGAGEASIDTGLPRTTGDARTPIAASMRRGPDGTWRVSEATHLNSTC